MPAQVPRDQGLAQVSRTTRWVVAGALVVAGMFTALAAKATPGRATTSAPAAGSTPSTTPPSPAGTGDAGTAGSASPDQPATTSAPPVHALDPSQAPASVSSGGS